MSAQDDDAPPALIVAGPTASGKSALALALAERLGGAVINADSMQVYRDLRILTARPTPEEEARVPHLLYGVRDAAEPASAGCEAWIEIKDSADRMLVSSLNPAGSERVVRGRPPYTLVIGNASSVRVTYDDKPIDLAPHTRQDVARLTVP